MACVCECNWMRLCLCIRVHMYINSWSVSPSLSLSVSSFTASVSLRDKISSWNFLDPKQGRERRMRNHPPNPPRNPPPAHSLAVIMYQIQRQQAGHIQDHEISQIVAFHRHFANTCLLSWWARRLCRFARHLFGWLARPCLLRAVRHHWAVLNLCLCESGWVYRWLRRRLCSRKHQANGGCSQRHMLARLHHCCRNTTQLVLVQPYLLQNRFVY